MKIEQSLTIARAKESVESNASWKCEIWDFSRRDHNLLCAKPLVEVTRLEAIQQLPDRLAAVDRGAVPYDQEFAGNLP